MDSPEDSFLKNLCIIDGLTPDLSCWTESTRKVLEKYGLSDFWVKQNVKTNIFRQGNWQMYCDSLIKNETKWENYRKLDTYSKVDEYK